MPSISIPVVRTQDMLLVQVNGYNVNAVVSAGQTYLVAANPSQAAYLTIVFPSQHTGERGLTPASLTTKRRQ